MKQLHVNITNKVATYRERDGFIICNNNDYEIVFAFDSEWNKYLNRIARFTWNGQYLDVEFTGSTCAVPVIDNADEVEVGVYVYGGISTTTAAVIGCVPSILSGGAGPHPETGQSYSTEAEKSAKAAAASAAEAAESARVAAASISEVEDVATASISEVEDVATASISEVEEVATAAAQDIGILVSEAQAARKSAAASATEAEESAETAKACVQNVGLMEEDIGILVNEARFAQRSAAASATKAEESAEAAEESAGAAATAAADAVTASLSEIINGNFEANTEACSFSLTPYKFLANDGSIADIDGAGFCVTSAIAVEPLKKYHIKTRLQWNNLLYAFYDNTGAFISGEQNTTSSGINNYENIVAAPEGAATLIVAAVTSSELSAPVVALVKGYSIIPSRTGYAELDENLQNSFIPSPRGFVEIPLEFTEPKAIQYGGEAVDNSYGINSTEYLDVSAYDYLRVSGALFWNYRVLAFYDKNKVFIEGFPTTGGSVIAYTDEVIKIPEGAVYMRVGDNSAAANKGVSTKIEYSTTFIIGKWSGKKWVCVGDSLTALGTATNKHYYDYVAEATGIEVVIMGVGGSGYAQSAASNNAFYQRVLNAPTDTDVVTIFGSFNDLSTDLEIGTASDAGTDTICGCINKTLDNVFATLPTVQVGVVAPTQWNERTTKQEEYVLALETICRARGIPFLDLLHCSNLHPDNETLKALTYSKDNGNGVHPDETGHRIIAPRFKAFLESLLM
jgi:lysophospholipase L1-like esterase